MPICCKILFAIFWLHVLKMEALTTEETINQEDLPAEFIEYLLQAGTDQSFEKQEKKLHDSPLGLFSQFPPINLCKDSPPDAENVYGHLYCGVMFALYALLIISLLIYQLRSILWLKNSLPNRIQSNLQQQQQHRPQEFELPIIINGGRSSNENIGEKPSNKENLSRLLPI